MELRPNADMSSIQIMSDLHLENPEAYDFFEIPPRAAHLALLGDIGNVIKHKDNYFAFLRAQLKQFKVVMLVAGNHEAYHSSWTSTLEAIREFENNVNRDQDEHLGEFVFLDRRAYQIPKTKTLVLGCSLFSHVPPESAARVSMGLNDFYQTEDWDTDKHNEAHQKDLEWLNKEVQTRETTSEDLEIFIFTHWSPSTDSRAVDPRHAVSHISTAFSTDLSKEPCFQDPRVKFWGFGHTHYNCDFMFERSGKPSLRLYANQRGYYWAQARLFDAARTINL